MPSILFVCTANRFRSPLAEAIFRAELSRQGRQADWQISSAGTWTQPGLAPMPEAISAASELGLDITCHRSRPISAALIQENTLVVVMESGQKEALTFEFPNSLKKTFLLAEITVGMAYDIPDPFSSEEPVREVVKELCVLIRDGFENICQVAERMGSGGKG
jgi:protein-tyrosine phosphatase